MKNKKKRKVLLLVLLLLAVSIGFAALSTTLKIIGTTSIAKNTWNIYWENKSVNPDGVSTTAPTLSAASGETANTIATWSVSLGKPGDFYEFTINAVNAGTIDAMIAENGITNTVVANNANTPEQLPSYISYTVTYEDGTGLAQYHLLAKGDQSTTPVTPTKEAYKVRVEFTDNITPAQMNAVPEGGYSYTFTTQVQYVQADSNAIDLHPPVITYGYSWDCGDVECEGYDEDDGWFTTLNSDAIAYLRKNNSTNTIEACGDFSSGTICLTPGNYESDFEDVNDEYENITTSSGLVATGLKGYSLTKAQEMLSKGALTCNVYDSEVYCRDEDYGFCGVSVDVEYNSVSCNNLSGVSCNVDNEGHYYYCTH